MSFPQYFDTLETDIHGLCKLPRHWRLSRLRHLADINPPKSEVSQLSPDLPVTFLPMEAIGEDGTLNLEQSRSLADVANGYTYFRDGDVAVAKITPCFENGKGAVMRGLCNGIGFGTTELIVARPNPDHITSDYLHWLFVSTYFRRTGESSMYGAGGQKRVPDDFVRNFCIGLPPLPEQHAIASFLDRETAKIDALVAEQRRLIELLKEKRQAVISHAVTKGLDPTVPMKDSEIEWLGEVPEHWAMTRLGRACDYISYGFTNPMPTADEGPYMITANDVDYGNVKYDSARRTTADAFDNLLTDKCRPTENDLLLTKDGTLGRIAIHDGRQACINQSVALLRVIKSRVIPEFACLALQGGIYQRRMIYEAGGTTIKHIYISRLAKMPMAFPGLVEQGEIVECLNDRLAKFNGLIAEAERAIDLLQERRAALISAAVTGKIDVRDHALQETA